MEKVTKSSRVRDKFMPLASGMNLSRTLELLVTFSVKWKLYYKLIGMAFMHGRSSMISFPSLKRIKITLSRGARFARSLLRGKFFYPLSRWKTYHALPPMHDRDISDLYEEKSHQCKWFQFCSSPLHNYSTCHLCIQEGTHILHGAHNCRHLYYLSLLLSFLFRNIYSLYKIKSIYLCLNISKLRFL